MKSYMKIHPTDSVAVALAPLSKGTEMELDGCLFPLTEDIAQGHKFALKDIPAGAPIIKYGQAIGYATSPISRGSWIHTHNIRTGLGDLLSYTYDKVPTPPAPPLSDSLPRTFLGYRRSDGRVGIRNGIWIIPTVGCMNNVAQAIERQAQSLVAGSVEEILAFPHPYGCSQMGDDQEHTRQILADLALHPNAGGVLLLGLGCENSSVEVIKQYLGDYDSRRIRFLVAQDSQDEIADALSLIEELADYASCFQREAIDVSELVIGMKCGGSDGLSGITANPTVGAFSDRLVALGGSTILTEVPEMFGAEGLLMNRCETRELFEDTVSMINDFKHYFTSHNQTIYENPSPGNKKGGISTLEDKSLGCTQKSGTALVRGVLPYGARIRNKGLHLLSAPGNDLVASTALAAAGAHMVLFTTGRGTPFASPVPTMKISTNSSLYRHKGNWIDFNCGSLVEGADPELMADDLFCKVIATASGEQTKSEAAGFHDMAIFKQGVTL